LDPNWLATVIPPSLARGKRIGRNGKRSTSASPTERVKNPRGRGHIQVGRRHDIPLSSSQQHDPSIEIKAQQQRDAIIEAIGNDSASGGRKSDPKAIGT
jgi:hypothetical protein